MEKPSGPCRPVTFSFPNFCVQFCDAVACIRLSNDFKISLRLWFSCCSEGRSEAATALQRTLRWLKLNFAVVNQLHPELLYLRWCVWTAGFNCCFNRLTGFLVFILNELKCLAALWFSKRCFVKFNNVCSAWIVACDSYWRCSMHIDYVPSLSRAWSVVWILSKSELPSWCFVCSSAATLTSVASFKLTAVNHWRCPPTAAVLSSYDNSLKSIFVWVLGLNEGFGYFFGKCLFPLAHLYWIILYPCKTGPNGVIDGFLLN